MGPTLSLGGSSITHSGVLTAYNVHVQLFHHKMQTWSIS